MNLRFLKPKPQILLALFRDGFENVHERKSYWIVRSSGDRFFLASYSSWFWDILFLFGWIPPPQSLPAWGVGRRCLELAWLHLHSIIIKNQYSFTYGIVILCQNCVTWYRTEHKKLRKKLKCNFKNSKLKSRKNSLENFKKFYLLLSPLSSQIDVQYHLVNKLFDSVKKIRSNIFDVEELWLGTWAVNTRY